MKNSSVRNKLLITFVSILLVCITGLLCTQLWQSNNAVLATTATTNVYKIFSDNVDDYTIKNDTKDTAVAGMAYDTTDDNPYILVSNYQFIKDGLISDTDKVFDITYTAKKITVTGGFAGYVGMMFGMQTQDDTFTTDGVYAMVVSYAGTKLLAGNGSGSSQVTGTLNNPAVTNYYYGGSKVQSEDFNVYTKNLPVTMRVVAYRNGTVELYRGFYDSNNGVYNTITELVATYTGVNVEGYIGFGVFDATSTDANQSVIYDMSIEGNVGEECEIYNGEINFGAGEYSVVNDSTNSIEADLNYSSVDTNPYTLVSNFKFAKAGLTNDTDVVFDITYTSTKTTETGGFTGYVGMLFGMKNQSDTISSNGVYAMVVGYAGTKLFVGNGSTYTQVTDVTISDAVANYYYGGSKVQSEDFNVYTKNLPVTMRVVAYRNGTVELYRDFYDSVNGVYNTITELVATYTGINVEGYVGFGAWGVPSDSDTNSITVDSVSGNIIVPEGSAITSNIAFDLTTIMAGDTVTLSATYTSGTNAVNPDCSFSIVAGEEYASITNGKLTGIQEGVVTIRVQSVELPTFYKDFDVNVERAYKVINAKLFDNNDDYVVKNDDTSSVSPSVKYLSIDDNPYTLVSKYKFTKENLSSDADKVFDISYTVKKITNEGDRNFDGYVGMLFGMKTQDDTINSKGVYAMVISAAGTKLLLGSGNSCSQITGTLNNPAEKNYYLGNSKTQSESFNVYVDNSPITIRVVAYKDGTVELYREFYDANNGVYNSIEELVATYVGIDVEGYIGFGAWGGTATDTRKNSIDNISVEGNLQIYDGDNVGEKITFNLEKINVGDTNVALNAVYTSLVGGESTCGYKVLSGSENVTISDGKITAIKAGTAKIQIYSLQNPSFVKNYDIIVTDYLTENFTFSEDFLGEFSINEGDWTIKDLNNGNIGISDKIFFESTYNENGVNPKMVFNVPFENDASTGIVFDITFTTYLGSIVSEKYQAGFMFGLEDLNSNFDSNGVGSVVVYQNHIKVYCDGLEVSPTFVTQSSDDNTHNWYGKESSFAYISEYTPLTLRLVGRADGVLEMYRGHKYNDLASSTSLVTEIENLYATYEGFDFSGYTAFFSNVNEKFGDTDFSVFFDDLTFKGKYYFDEFNGEVLEIGFDTFQLMNLMHTKNAIELYSYVNCKPNLEYYRRYTISIIKGNGYIDENNCLITNEPGEFTIKIASDYDSSKFQEVSFTVGELIITDLNLNEKDFHDLTIYTQPLLLSTTVESNTYISKYLAVEYELLTDNAVIELNKLRILEEGVLRLKVSSVYNPDVYKIYEYNVTNPDANSLIGSDSCSSSIDPLPYMVIGTLLLALGYGVLRIKRKKEN